MNIAILGFGLEGKSILQYLRKSPAHKNADITILDRDPKLKIPRGVRAILGPNYLTHLTDFDLVFRSPGIPYNLPEIQNAINRGVQFSSTTKLFFEHARGTIIGITGTKGKGTTATLLYKMMKANNEKVLLAGNIGVPAITLLQKLNKNSLVILELSSFQLHDLEASPRTAVVLDIFPDHMDAHDDFEEYVGAKSSIARFQQSTDAIFYAAENVHARMIAEQSAGMRIAVSPMGFTLFTPSDLRITGAHNFKNAVMAATVARHYGIPDDMIVAVVKKFRGLPYRLELARTIRDRKTGATIQFINDSAGTNPSTAAAAVRAFPRGTLIVIAGGKDKGAPFDPFAEAIAQAPNVARVILMGENREKIAEALQQKFKAQGSKFNQVTNLNFAIHAAYQYTKTLVASGQTLITILFAPGSASFDQFADYKDRGAQFNKIVAQLR